jgi:predicted metalloprotease
MRWQGRRESDNVEDRRNESGGQGGNGLGGMRIPIRGKSGIVIVIVVLVAGYYGIDLSPLITGGQSQNPSQYQQRQTSGSISPNDDRQAKFTSVILASTEDVWTQIFKQNGMSYRDPKLVMYRGATRTGCGTGQSVMGPFYCPADSTVYIDLSFYQELRDKLGAGGDFAQGYVVAHEVGHHVQNLLGIERKVRQMQQGASQTEVMQQEQVLEDGDLKQALDAARAIGDDKLQQQSQGRVVPDSFTHGTSAQRYEWFKRGYDSGKMDQCNTFASR